MGLEHISSPRICTLGRERSAAGEHTTKRPSRMLKLPHKASTPHSRREPVLGAVFREAISRHVTFLALLLRDGDGMGCNQSREGSGMLQCTEHFGTPSAGL